MHDAGTVKPKVIVLCGGKGERLYPLTNNIPKPLLKIKEKPILSHIIDHLSKYDLKDLIITTGYKAEIINEFITSNYADSMIQMVDSGDADIVKRIQESLEYIDGDFMLLYGDTLSNIDINDLIKYHHASDSLVTMAVWPLTSQFGIVEVDETGKVSGFKEKPRLDKWINIGYFYFNKEMAGQIRKYSNFAELLIDVANDGILAAYKHEGIHITVNTIKELAEAERNINRI